MRNIILISIILFGSVVKAQPPSKFYTKFGGAGIDIGYGVKQTYDKGYIVVGSTTSYGAGASDVYLVKLDSMGAVKWSKTFGGFGNDVGRSIIQLNDSGFVLTGFTNSFGSGGYDVVIIRTDKNGNQLWQKTWGGTDWDFGYDIVQASDGGLIICGSTTSFGYGGKDGLLLKYDIDGNLIWNKYYGGAEDDEFKAVTSKNGSDFFAGGTTKSYGDVNGDMYAVKINNSGDSMMTISHGGNLYDGVNDIVINQADTIILVGGSESFSSGKMDAFYASFKHDGTFVSQRFHGFPEEDEEFFCVTNSLSTSLEEVVAVYTTQEVASYKKDIKTIFMNESGDWWGGFESGSFGFSGDDEVFDISGTHDKGYIQVGYTTSFFSQDKDVFLVKRDSLLYYGTLVVSVSENTLSNNTAVAFPNPLNSGDNLNIRNLNPISEIEIFDISGRKIAEFIYAQKENELKLNFPYPEGFYLVKITDSKGAYVLKILKN